MQEDNQKIKERCQCGRAYNSSRYNDNKGKRKHYDTKADPNKKPKVTYWKYGKPEHLKKDCKAGNVGNKANRSGTKGSVDGSSNSLKGQNMFNTYFQVYNVTYVSKAYFVQDDDVAWWVDLGAIVHVCKDRYWIKTYESLNDGSILHMGNESTALMHGRGCVDLRMQDMFKDGLIPAFDMETKKLICMICMLLLHWRNKKYFVTFIDDASRFCYIYLLYSKDEALDKFKVFKTEVELQQGSLIKRFRTDRGGEYMDTLYFQFVGIIHEMTAPYTPQQNGISERKNRVVKEMVNSMLSYSGLSQGFWGEAMAVVRLPDPKLKTVGERGIECIFVEYAKNSKVFRFYVIEPNDSVAINSIIESRDAIFDENRFSTVPRPSQRFLVKGNEDTGGAVALEKVTEEVVLQLEHELRKSKRYKTLKDFRPEFQLYLIKGTRDEVSDQHSYCFNVEDDPKSFDEAIKFSMKDMKEVDVILGIRIKHISNGIVISQSHYIKKALTKFNYFDCTPVSTPMDMIEKLMPNNGQAVSQLEYTSNPGTQHWQAIQRVFLFGGGAISWAFKKQTCITGSIMKSEFVALAAASKEAKCAATLAKAYSKMYNRKSRHLCVRHSMIRELVTNGVVSIEFARSQQKLADQLTKGLTRDLVIKSAEGMGLKIVRNLVQLWVQFIPDNRTGVHSSVSNSGLKDIHESDGFSVSRRIPSRSNPSEEVSLASKLISELLQY
ncbi:zinc finger, CCHC-type containing protein [Tanacetum coccineum]|uniref:Zinc finger, CCHC-type containing protein n=1 Tax=Tanacetum coccineum TaxID=301880 RepID=A0ABQ4XYC0_9ASTR